MSIPHVVIVGGGFGGLAAAQALKRAPVTITLIDRRNHHLFQPLLYQVATAGLSPGDIASPIRWVLRRQRNARVLLGEARAIDVARRTVTLEDGELSYDFLIVAAGSTHAYFGHPEWEAFAPGLKTLDDALEIRRRMLLAYERAERETDPAERQRLLTFAVVGGGPTGVEMAGAIAEIARQTLSDEFRTIDPTMSQVVLIEAGPSILSTFPADLRDKARASLEKLHVRVRENTRVMAVDARGISLGHERLDAATIVWAAGVAASPLAQSLGVPLDRAGRVPVQPDLSLPGHPDVFVIGDLATLDDKDGTPLPGVAPVAQQEAAHAARTIVRTIEGQPRRPFRYRNYGNLATIGRAAAIADFGRVHVSGLIGWLMWLFIHIMKLVGFRNRVLVLIQWAAAYFTYQRSVRLITGRQASYLRDEPMAPAEAAPVEHARSG
jgi:NADH dehydrogenase